MHGYKPAPKVFGVYMNMWLVGLPSVRKSSHMVPRPLARVYLDVAHPERGVYSPGVRGSRYTYEDEIMLAVSRKLALPHGTGSL
jgi:hypothetical protein